MIKNFTFGLIKTNCYLVFCPETRDAGIIDPDPRTKNEKNELVREIKRRHLSIKYIINTHYHSDHIGGNRILKENYHAQILIHEMDASVLPEPWKWWQRMIQADPTHHCPICGNQGNYLNVIPEQNKAVLGCPACGFNFDILSSPPADRLLHQGDLINIGNLIFKVIHTPGHTPGGICLYSEKERILFSGDTLFCGSIGRTDNIDASYEDIMKSVNILAQLPGDTIVYPGHGAPTTISQELKENPFLKKTAD